MKTICTKCRSDEVYIDVPKEEKEEQVQTMDDLKNAVLVPLVYKLTTYRCKKCGYSVSF